jgi:Uma2 family endonuclease
MQKTGADYLYTYKDLAETRHDPGFRYEIIEGELLVTPAPVPYHQVVILNLYEILRRFIRARKLGRILSAPVDVHLSEETVVQPDLFFCSDPSIVKEEFVEGAPDLVVEVLSRGTAKRDLGIKRDAYERHGVKHYWIVDPLAKEILELVRRGKKLVRRTTVKGNDAFEPTCFPGLKIRLKRVWSTD